MGGLLRADASGFDTLLHLRSACDDPASELACDDDGGPRRDARIETELEAGTYFLFMDGWRDSVGSYELDLRLTALMPDAGMPDAGPVDAANRGGAMNQAASSAFGDSSEADMSARDMQLLAGEGKAADASQLGGS